MGRYRVKPRLVSATVIGPGDPLLCWRGVSVGDYCVWDGDVLEIVKEKRMKEDYVPVDEKGDDISWEEDGEA